MTYEFRWNDVNVDHIGEHNIVPSEAEYVVNHPYRGYPRAMEDDKYLAKGQTAEGHYIQVIYIFDPPGVVYVLHARSMTVKERRALNRTRR
jgi:uncharacterized DUF497 family protein